MPFEVQYGGASPQLLQGAADAAVTDVINRQNQTTLDFVKLASGANIDWARLQQQGDISYADRQNRNDLAGFNAGVDMLKQFNQNQFSANQSGLDRQFRANESSAQRQFQGSESAADRAAKFDLQGNAQDFQGGQADLDRALRETLQGNAQDFTSGESALDRALRESLQGNAQDFQASQSGLERAARFDLQGNSQDFQGGQAEQNRRLQAAEHNLTPVMGYSQQALAQRQQLDESDAQIRQGLVDGEWDNDWARQALADNEQRRQGIQQSVTGYQQQQPQVPQRVQQWVDNPANRITTVAPGIYRNAAGDTFQWDQHRGAMTPLSQREQFGPQQFSQMIDAYMRRPNANPDDAMAYALQASRAFNQEREVRTLPAEVQQQIQTIDSQLAPARAERASLNTLLHDLTTATKPNDIDDALHAIPGFERVPSTPQNVTSARNILQLQIANAQRVIGQLASTRQDVIADGGGGQPSGGAGPSWDNSAPQGSAAQGAPQAGASQPPAPSALGSSAEAIGQGINDLRAEIGAELRVADLQAQGRPPQAWVPPGPPDANYRQQYLQPQTAPAPEPIWGIPRPQLESFEKETLPRLEELMNRYGADPRRYPNARLAAEFIQLTGQLNAVNAARIRDIERRRAARG